MDKIKSSVFKLIETPTLISILLGFSLLILQIWAREIPPSVQMAFFAFFMFLTGIPHGAVDDLVEKETAKKAGKPFDLPIFIAKYVLIMLFYGIAWYALPSFSLLFFLLISAWHFGETDIEKAPKMPLWNLTRFVFGSFILLFILLMHNVETTPILTRISQNNNTVLSICFLFVQFRIPVLIISLIGSFVLFYLANKKDVIFIDRNRYGRLFLILFLTYFLPLLPAFALYFGGWHALCSFKTIHYYIVEKAENGQFFSPISFLKTWSKTLTFSLLAMASLGFAAWYWEHFLQTFDPLPLLFIFLSLITLPHLTVMHKIN